MSTLTSIEAAYASPPHQRTSVSPDPTKVASMHVLQSHPDGEVQRAYLPSETQAHWSACSGSQASSDDLDNYALHSSPALSSLQQEAASGQSSPRSWANSPKQYGPMAWEQVSEYPRLDPQLSGYPPASNTPTSFPAHTLPFIHTVNSTESAYTPMRSQTEPYPAGYRGSPTNSPSTPESGVPLSPCSTTLGLTLEEGLPSPSGTVDDMASPRASKESSVDGSRGPNNATGAAADGPNKGEEPYAQLIYKAFLSTPRHAMTLQEIYRWFRENTDKGKDESKGWQNSIRHNLSMNMAFTKRERKSSPSKDGDSEKDLSSSSDSKKSTEWYLEPWAVAGVQSTTRYRKGNQSRRSATSGGLSARAYRSYPPHHRFSRDFASGHSRGGSSSSSSRPKGGVGAASIGVLTGRIKARSPGAAAAGSLRSSNATASHLQHHLPYHFVPHPHHLHQHLVNDPSSYAFYHHQQQPRHPPPQHHHAYHHSQPVDMATPTSTPGSGSNSNSDLECDYPDPVQLYHHPPHSAIPGPHRAASESAVDEPVTPEPGYGEQQAQQQQGQQQQGLHLPDLRGSSHAQHAHQPHQYTLPVPVHHPQPQHHQQHQHQHQVGVYDEVIDRFGGWGGVTATMGVGVEVHADVGMGIEGGYAQGY